MSMRFVLLHRILLPITAGVSPNEDKTGQTGPFFRNENVRMKFMAFDTALVKQFSVKPDLEEWGQTARIGDVADLLLVYE